MDPGKPAGSGEPFHSTGQRAADTPALPPEEPAKGADQLLRTAIVRGSEDTLTALDAAGPSAIHRFRDLLSSRLRLEFPQMDMTTFCDHMMAVSCHLASRFPGEYVATFNSAQWQRYSEVLAGLGYTGRPQVRQTLIDALSRRQLGITRFNAARALGRFPGPDSVQALLRVVADEDEDYLVQYHAIQSLGQIGDGTALEQLLAIAAKPPNRGIAMIAPKVAAGLARRLGVSVQVPRPDMSRWPTLKMTIASEENG